MSSPAVVMRNVSKTFDGVQVLHGVDLEIAPGEIHGLVGENGSGKSTLVKILGGVHTPDRDAEIRLRGQVMPLPVPSGQRHGLAIIHQDLALVESMSVADNVGISTGYERGPVSRISRRREREVVRGLAEGFGLALDPDRMVGDLSPAERSVVAILRALRQLGTGSEGNVIVLDEPTAALPRDESVRLLELLRVMAGHGTAVLYISHRMHEVLTVCDRISVLRSGHLVATQEASTSTEAGIVELMLGYELGEFYPEKHVGESETVRLQVQGLTAGPVTDLSFTVQQGEILGITGLAGMGQDELPYLIAGGAASLSGEVAVNGVAVDGSPRSAKRAGLELVPGNRQRDALWLEGSAAENLTLPFLRRFWRRLRLSARRERAFADVELAAFAVRPLSPDLQITKFSGGNQQKVVMARAMRQEPGVVLLHEPTQGVDAGAKKEILGVVSQAAQDGAAVVVFSSDSEEVAQLCHRVLVLRYGTVSAELGPGEVSEDRIISLSQRVPVSETSAS